MKTLKRQQIEMKQYVKSDEFASSTSVAAFNPVSEELLALVAQRPFFKGMTLTKSASPSSLRHKRTAGLLINIR